MSLECNEVLNNIWEIYGVKQDPFTTSPIMTRGGNLSIECFVGRTDNVNRLGKTIGSKGGSRTLVYGDTGVGKTTFVNVVRAHAIEKGYFTPFKEIAVQSDWTADDFILNTLAGIYTNLKLVQTPIITEETFKKLNSLLDGIKNKGAVSVIVSGEASYNTQRVGAEYTTVGLHEFFRTVIREIIEKTGNDIIIHYNNLELMPDNKLRKLFENLRDFFQTPSIHFIFVGNLTVHACFQSMPRFSSTLTDTPIHIETLTIDEIELIIKKRFEYLRIRPELNYLIPYNRGCLNALFELWGGNIRYILNSLSTAVREITTEKPVILDEDSLAVTLQDVLEKRYLKGLTTKAREVLLEAAKHEEITNKALAENLKMPPSNVSTYVKDLQESGCMYLRRKNGKDKFWSVESKVKWSLLTVRHKDQRTLDRFWKA